MATFTKLALSGSNFAVPIQITTTGASGTSIHTSSTSSTVIDEVWLWATNTSGNQVKLTVGYGGTTTQYLIEQTIPAESGLVMVVPGLIIFGDGSNANEITAWAGTGSVINVIGYVNRIS